MGWLSERYELRFEPGLFERTGFLAGSDERRLGELARALDDPQTRAIVAARGGYGLSRIAHRLELEQRLRSAPKWLVGFSDFTVLHVEAARAGVMSLHASNAGELGRGSAAHRDAWRVALEEPERECVHSGLHVWSSGAARGRLFGGNLTILFTAAATGRLFVPEGAVLVIEDVTEAPYRIDRMLTALLVSGALAKISGIAVGLFTDCTSARYRITVEEVLRERLCGLGVPVVAGLPFGHELPNVPLHLGALAELDTDRAELKVMPGAC